MSMMMKVLKIILIIILLFSMKDVLINGQGKDNSFSKPSRIGVFWHSFFSRVLMGPFYQSYFNQLPLKGNEKVLDFGCGWGAEARILAKKLCKGGRLACLDISPQWIAETKEVLKKYNNVDYYVGDIVVLNIPESSFDAVCIHIVLHDIDVNLRPDIVKAIARIIKPGGHLYIREPLMAERQISASSIESLMNKAGLLERSVKFKRSFWYGEIVEMVFEKKGE